MPFSYSCFISYRNDNAQIAKDFQESLEDELSLLLNQPVYRDEERLHGGDFYNVKIARALCRSACMVMLYIPKYFDEGHIYCAREFRAMELLEQERLVHLKANGLPDDCGLIIPVVYRGCDVLPQYIKGSRNFYDFEAFFLGGRTQKRNHKYLLSMKEIANYIFQRCRDLNSLPLDPCDCCDSFDIPNESDLNGWLDNLLPSQQKFPGR